MYQKSKKQDCPHFLLTKDNKHISKISIYFDTSRILFKSEMTMNYKYSITSKYNYCANISNFNLLTVACNCSILVIIILFFFRTRDWNRESPKPHHLEPPNSTHTWTLIQLIAARVSVLIQITILDLEPDPCFQIFLNISKTNYRIFNCNMSNRRSSQELPFIFFELRAATCL